MNLRAPKSFARVLLVLAVALTTLATATPANATAFPLDPGTWTAGVFPTKTTQPTTGTSVLDTTFQTNPGGTTALPNGVLIDFPVGHLFAHADSDPSAPPASPSPSDPVNGDLVATFAATGQFGLFGCVPNTVVLPAFWDEPFTQPAIAGQVAELSIGPTSIGFLYARITRTGVGPYTYHLTAGIPIALLACPGSTLQLTTKMFDYTRRVLAASPFTTSMPTTRVFQMNSVTPGAQATTLSYAAGVDTYSGTSSYTADLAALTDVTAPTAAFTGIPGSTIVSGQVVVTAADDSGVVAAVEFGADRTATIPRSLGAANADSFPGPYQLDSSVLSDGPHELFARAIDLSNNFVNAASAPVIVDNVIPGASFTNPTTLTGPVQVDFNEPDMTGIDIASFIVTNNTTTAPVPGSVACKNATGGAVACGSGTVKSATFTPNSPWIPGESYTSELNPVTSATIADAAANTMANDVAPFRALLVNQENSPAARYGWRRVATGSAYGGSYNYDHLANSTATYKFTGTGIVWYTVRGPAFGKAKVYIDGVLKRSMNLYRAATLYKVPVSIGGLAAGTHTLKILVMGQRGSPAGVDSRVAVDAFKVGAVNTASPSVTYGWRAVASGAASAGRYVTSNVASSTMTFTFHSTRFDWFSARGPSMGIARLYIDGVLRATYNNYGAATAFGLRRRISGLANAVHTAKIVVTGTKSAASSGTHVVVDRIVLL